MRKLLFLLIPVLLGACGAVEAEPPDHAVVFMYHRFGDDRYPSTNVTLKAFEAQLAHLQAHGYRIWPLSRIVTHLAEGRPIPERTVALSVDDAYRTVYENAWPRLRALGWPLTVFVSTDGVDGGSQEFMTWAQMREMQAAGVAFANHSASHGHLVHPQPGEDRPAWRQRVRGDIRKAEQRLREELGVAANPGRLFAYPYGEYSAELAGIVADLGFTAFGQHSGALGPYADTRALPRFPINEGYSDPGEFALKAASLPLPVVTLEPWDPLLDGDNPPRLEIGLAPSDAELDRLACYASGRGRTPVLWRDREARRFSVQADSPFPPGRARYNCTAPSASGHWYWFSQPWVIPPTGAAPDH